MREDSDSRKTAYSWESSTERQQRLLQTVDTMPDLIEIAKMRILTTSGRPSRPAFLYGKDSHRGMQISWSLILSLGSK